MMKWEYKLERLDKLTENHYAAFESELRKLCRIHDVPPEDRISNVIDPDGLREFPVVCA